MWLTGESRWPAVQWKKKAENRMQSGNYLLEIFRKSGKIWSSNKLNYPKMKVFQCHITCVNELAVKEMLPEENF